MEIQQKPRVTPVMILKIFGLSVSMGVGFGFAFYAGYNSIPYLLPPIFFLEMSCSPCFVLISRYLKGRLFQLDQLNNLKGSFYLGCVILCLSVVSSFVYALMSLGYIHGYIDEAFAEYIALGTSLLAVFWSSILIYDAKYYWQMWLRVVGSNNPGPQIFLHP